MTKSDVIVIGGGPSGSAAAYHLARGGARVRVVDASDVLGGRYIPLPDPHPGLGDEPARPALDPLIRLRLEIT